MYAADKTYITMLTKALELASPEALEIIMGPEELKNILLNTKPTDFLGTKPWINLHTHSNASDGQLSPVQWVENAFHWMQENHLMRYVITLTDHDTIDGLIPVLKYTAKNHKKLKGLRIVLGCELSTSFEDQQLRLPLDFEILHYGINPFDKNYCHLLKVQSKNRSLHLKNLFQKIKEKYPWLTVDFQQFQKSPFYGPNMQKGLGCNWLYDVMSYLKSTHPKGSNLSEVFDEVSAFGFQSQGQGMWYPVDQLLSMIQTHGGFASLAHPYRLQLGQKLNVNALSFIPYLFGTLSQKGLLATELYYGNMPQMQAAFNAMLAQNNPINETDKWIQCILNTSHQYFHLATGGADNHGTYLGNSTYKTSYSCWQDLLHFWKNTCPLVQKGYRLLNKEVTMGLPGPCMPVFDINYDLGIGSPYGLGAKRIWNFFGETINKILLGPGGRTTRDAKHSPYVSDEEHPNPFFIPPEFFLDQGTFSYEDILRLKHPSITERIDFDMVEENFSALFSKTHPSSNKIDLWAGQVKQKNTYPYIADLQIQIPKHVIEKNQDLFLTDFVLGTPGDNLSDKPRNWGFPVFNPHKLFQRNGILGPAGKLWQSLIDQAIIGAKGGLRIDHFIGFVNPFVISINPDIPNGRLFSSYNHPILAQYAFHHPEQFYQITERIVFPVLKKHGLTLMDLYPEDIGARPEQLDDVLSHFGLGRLVVAEFNHPQEENHLYQLRHTHPYDVATLDTHDTPSVQSYFENLCNTDRYNYAINLAKSLRFHYTDDLKSTEQLIRMQWAELLMCPAKRIQAFFTSWIGQSGRYNQPGNPDKWRLRCTADFDKLYFKNLYAGRAYNPLDAIALAIFARGDDFYQKNADFVRLLREKENTLKELIRVWLDTENSTL